MELFNSSRLVKNENGYTLILFADQNLTEFSKELGEEGSNQNENLQARVYQYVKNKFPNIAITTVNIMVGSLLLASFPFQQTNVQAASISPSHITEQAQYGVKIQIDGKYHQFSKEPRIINGTTFIPIRDVAESLGANVWWNGETRTVGIRNGETDISFIVGSTLANVDGKQVSMQPAFIEDGTTLVPVRFVSEAMGLNVDWEGTSRTVIISSNVYAVQPNDTLWSIAQKNQTTVQQLKEINNLSQDPIYPGQTLYLKKNVSAPTQEKLSVSTTQQTESLYRVQTGDTLLGIANKYNVDVDEIKRTNQLVSDTIYAGQTLKLHTDGEQLASISYIEHTIVSGDNIWNLSVKYGIPQQELLNANNFTQNTLLMVGQKIKVPVHNIPVKETVSPKHGELLDWWTEAQYVFPIGKTATVTDFQTGKSFQVKRTIGANHADSEPLTYADTQTAKSIWGGYSWDTRPVIVEVDGRKIAASMSFYPHDVQYITDNGFNGHFDIHFKNSTRHKDGQITPSHQEDINVAAGVTGY